MSDFHLLALDVLTTLDRHAPAPRFPWGAALLGLVAWAVFGSAGQKKAKFKQPPAGVARFQRCGECRTEHPHFAAYCRQCGRKF